MSEEYKQLEDNDVVELKDGERVRFSCCDCGLVHDMWFFTKRGGRRICFGLRRNNRSTALRRYHREKKK